MTKSKFTLPIFHARRSPTKKAMHSGWGGLSAVALLMMGMVSCTANGMGNVLSSKNAPAGNEAKGAQRMATVKLSAADQGKVTQLRVGDTLEIDLNENPTTGYQWALVGEPNPILALQSTDFEQGTGGQLGAAGLRKLVFRAQRNGESSLALKLWREWEGDASIVERFAAKVQVNQ